MLTNLSIDQNVQNLYTFVDGLWCRLYQGYVINFPASLLQKIIDVREEHGWEMLGFEYVHELFPDRDTIHLIRHLKSCDELVSKGRKKTKVIFFDYLSPIDFVKNMFMKDNSFNFQLSDTKYADQQFVLTTKAVKGYRTQGRKTRGRRSRRRKTRGRRTQGRKFPKRLDTRAEVARAEVDPMTWAEVS